MLEGTALRPILANIAPFGNSVKVFKVGFSNDPERRRREQNAYFPDSRTLEWRTVLAEWHVDEINAWAMEQEIFSHLQAQKAVHVKGEIYALTRSDLDVAWASAVRTAKRPTGVVEVTIGDEERLAS
ncbi:hypothetical protein ACWFZ6_18520 [Methylorubrum extorquens]